MKKETAFKDNELTGEVLVTLNDKPVITTDSFTLEKERFLQAHPHIRDDFAVVGSQLVERYILKKLIDAKIIDEWAILHKIDETVEYKRDLKKLCEGEIEKLNVQFFREKVTNGLIDVSDEEIRSWYKEDVSDVLVSTGGIPSIGIQFGERSSAERFLALAQVSPHCFKQVAYEQGLADKIFDFGLMYEGKIVVMNKLLRDTILRIKTLPAVELFEIRGTFWVIYAQAKEEKQSLEYAQVKQQLKKELEDFKRAEIVEQVIDRLKKEYMVQVDEDYFENDVGSLREHDSSHVLVMLKGVPILTVGALLEKRKEYFAHHSFYAQKMYRKNPQQYDRNLLDALISQKVIDEFVVLHKINQTDEYKAELQDACKEMQHQLNKEFFSKKIEKTAVKVSDAEVWLWIEANWITGLHGTLEEEPEYISYEKLDDHHKASVKKDLEDVKRAELVEQEIQVLRKEYVVKVNESYFE